MTEETSENVKVPAGPPWKNESTHCTFEKADSIRQKLLRIWRNDPKHEGMQVKIKKMRSPERFVVKVRQDPNCQEDKKTKGKKNGKSRKRNKKNSSGGMFDSTASI